MIIKPPQPISATYRVLSFIGHLFCVVKNHFLLVMSHTTSTSVEYNFKVASLLPASLMISITVSLTFLTDGYET